MVSTSSHSSTVWCSVLGHQHAAADGWRLWRAGERWAVTPSADPPSRPRCLVDTSAQRVGPRLEVFRQSQADHVGLPVADEFGHTSTLAVPRRFAELVADALGYAGLVVRSGYPPL